MRGVAVALVFLFHLRVAGFGAGYLGVDVFFVLSGFLITSLLLDEVQRTGRIALTSFWARRVRRLLPALVLLLLVVALVTWLTATFSERAALRGDLLAATSYVANWRFISTSGYFVSTGIESPLQHTWSLAIEEQFYLIWPMLLTVLVLVVKRPRIAVGALAALGVAGSAILLAVLWSPDGVERAYMGTDARIFEPLVGALGAVLLAHPRSRPQVDQLGGPLVLLGGAGLVACLIVIRPDTAVYYYGGALGVSTASLMLVAPLWLGHGGPLRRALEWAPVVWLGAISYGVYLWHWPMTIWLGAHQTRGLEAGIRGAAVVLCTVGAAAISYYAIERPIRAGRRTGRSIGRHAGRSVRGGETRRRRWALGAVPVALVAVACVSVAATNVPPPDVGVPVVMLTGDSVPLHLEVALDREATARGWRVVSAAHGSCSVTGETVAYRDGEPVRESEACASIAGIQDELIRTMRPEVVIWWDRWSVSDFITADGEHVRSGSDRFWRLRRAGLRASAERLALGGATVVFVATEPPGKAVGSRCTEERCNEWVRFQIERYHDITARWNSMMRRYAQQHADRSTFVSLTDIVCRTDVAPCDDLIDGVPARSDGTHYTGAGEAMVIDALAARLADILEHGRS